MKIDWNTNLYCLIGKPIDGTYSPIIHNYIYKKQDINSSYMAFNVDEDKFEDAIEGFLAIGLKGFNLTAPYKEKIIPYLDEITEDAKNIGAINTVKNENGKLIGTNTDGDGFIKMFYDNQIDLKDKKLLLIGAGGAARGICFALMNEKLSELTIINRTKDKADKLKEELDSLRKPIKISSLHLDDDFNREDFDILINTTTVGMEPDSNSSPISLEGFNEKLMVCDVVYKPLKTKLLEDAEKRGYDYYNGIPMLVNQAILVQEFWLGRKLDSQASMDMITYMDKYLKEE